MADDLRAKIAEMFMCRCDPAWTERNLHAPDCEWVEVHVWPAEGPHWAETPRFAKVLSPDEDEDDDEEETP